VGGTPIQYFLVQRNMQGSPHALQLMSQQIRVESPVWNNTFEGGGFNVSLWWPLSVSWVRQNQLLSVCQSHWWWRSDTAAGPSIALHTICFFHVFLKGHFTQKWKFSHIYLNLMP